MSALDELRNKLRNRQFTGTQITMLELAVLYAQGITVSEHEQAAAELAAKDAQIARLETVVEAAKKIEFARMKITFDDKDNSIKDMRELIAVMNEIQDALAALEHAK